MSEPTLAQAHALLDVLRPPHGYRVRCAAFATYSLDLVVAVAALLALAGFGEEEGKQVDFADSLDRMRGRLRFVAQEGRTSTSMPKAAITRILDQFVRTIRMDERRSAWHPKMAYVVFEPNLELPNGSRPLAEIRRVWLGSRNLTTHLAMDIGLALESHPSGQPIDGLGHAIGALLVAADLDSASAVEEARACKRLTWVGPPQLVVEEVRWMDEPTRGFPAPLAVGAGVLHAISPFLDIPSVREVGRWPARCRTLLTTAGAFADIRSWGTFAGYTFVRTMAPVPEDPIAWEETEQRDAADQDARPTTMGLHAKMLVAVRADDFEAWVGSANLSGRGWKGPNVEIVARVRGPRRLYDALGLDHVLAHWAKEVTAIAPVAVLTPDEELVESLERARNEVAAQWDVEQHVRRSAGEWSGTPILAAKGPPWPKNAEFVFRVRLLGGPSVEWPRDKLRLTLPAVGRADETELVQLELASKGQVLRWIARAPFIDGIPEDRDRRALLRHLGPRAFLQWIRSMLVGEDGDGGGHWHTPHTPSPRGAAPDSGLPFWAPSLEDLLRSWARDGGVAVARADAAVTRSLELLEEPDIDFATDADREAHDALRELHIHWKRVVATLLEPA